MTARADVVVLGAGAEGCAVAYYLAREGLRVSVIERDAIGSGASGSALGLLNPTNEPGPLVPLLEASFKLHLDLFSILEAEAQMELHVRRMPHLELALTADQVPALKAEMQRWSTMDGFSTEWLEPAEVLRLEPRVNPDVQGAVLLRDVVLLDSYRFTLALARAAESHGARFVQGEAVAIRRAGSRPTGVVLDHGEISCDAVVVALGPWSGAAGDWLEIDIPVTPQKGEIIQLEGFDPPPGYHMHGGPPADICTVVQKADGLVWVAATRSDAGFDDSLSVEARDVLIRRGLAVMPCLGERRLVRHTACMRPITPDAFPVLGSAPGSDGIYLATGAAGKGILLAPAMGLAVSDLLIRGRTQLPIARCTPERFVS